MNSVISMVSGLMSSTVSTAIAAFTYIFTALSLFTIGKRRGIDKPWMAWVPFANSYFFGKVADDHNEKSNGRQTNYAKWMLVLQIIGCAVAIIATIVYLVVIIVRAIKMGDANIDVRTAVLSVLGPSVIYVLIIVAAFAGVSILQHFAAFQIFRSCDPDKSVLYLMLSIFINITLPIFLFICRNKDLGYMQNNVIDGEYKAE